MFGKTGTQGVWHLADKYHHIKNLFGIFQQSLEGSEKVSTLKISGIETVFCSRFSFVEVTTNEGITGVGECVCSDQGVLESAIRLLRSGLIGEDPFNVEKIWRKMYGTVFFYLTPSIMSAIDIALWDIMGKKLGVPCYELLGGLYHNRIRLYTHLRGAWNSYPDKESDYIYYEDWGKGDSPGELAKNAKDLVAEGYTAFKLDPFAPGKDRWPNYRPAEMKKAVARVAAIREAVGDDIDIIVEAHNKFNASTAITIGKMLEELNVLWYEDPVPAGQLKALQKVSRQVNIPIAAGERLFTKFEYKDYLETGAVDVLMADVGKVGGITELKKISVLTETYKTSFSPHNPFGPVSAVASAHVCASSPAFLILEHEHFIPWAIEPPINAKDGYIRLSSGPGLGISLNKEEIARRSKSLQEKLVKPGSMEREKCAPAL